MIFFFMIIYQYRIPRLYTAVCGSRIFSCKGEGVVRKKTVFAGEWAYFGKFYNVNLRIL